MDKEWEDNCIRSCGFTTKTETDLNLACPIEWFTLRKPDDRHRDVWCLYYNNCLDWAIENKWESFSCTACSLKGKRREGMKLANIQTKVHPERRQKSENNRT